jgi:hypothetical protein
MEMVTFGNQISINVRRISRKTFLFILSNHDKFFDCIEILRRVAANILNKQSRRADKGWSYNLGVGRGFINNNALTIYQFSKKNIFLCDSSFHAHREIQKI